MSFVSTMLLLLMPVGKTLDATETTKGTQSQQIGRITCWSKTYLFSRSLLAYIRTAERDELSSFIRLPPPTAHPTPAHTHTEHDITILLLSGAELFCTYKPDRDRWLSALDAAPRLVRLVCSQHSCLMQGFSNRTSSPPPSAIIKRDTLSLQTRLGTMMTCMSILPPRKGGGLKYLPVLRYSQDSMAFSSIDDLSTGSRTPTMSQNERLPSTSWDDDHTLFSSQQLPTDSLPPCGSFSDPYSQLQEGFTQPANDLPRPHGANRLVRTDTEMSLASSQSESLTTGMYCFDEVTRASEIADTRTPPAWVDTKISRERQKLDDDLTRKFAELQERESRLEELLSKIHSQFQGLALLCETQFDGLRTNIGVLNEHCARTAAEISRIQQERQR